MSSIKSSLVFWRRNKVYTAICFFGLAVSLLFVILIADFTISELRTDSFHKNANQIYAIGNEEFTGTAYGLKPYLQDQYPQIEQLCFVHLNSGRVVVNGNKSQTDVLLADSTFFSMFDFPLLQGDRYSVMDPMNSAVVSESFANIAFGGKDPMGQIITVGQAEYTVTGVCKDFEESIFPNVGVIIRMEQVGYFNNTISIDNLNNAASCMAFIRTKEGAKLEQTEEMLAYFSSFFWIYERGIVKQIKFIPLKDLYFDNHIVLNFRQGDKTLVTVLIAVAILVLLFAIINYINLTVAQSGFRAKEMATRRLLGASRKEIFIKMIAESLLFCAVAALVAFLISITLDKSVGNLMECRMDVIQDMTPAFAVASLVSILLVGLISGVIPACIISGFQPIEVVRGIFLRRTKMVFSKVFITFQNVITIVLIACSITMISQMYYVTHTDMGYNTDNLLRLENIFDSSSKWDAFKNELKQLSCVKEVSLCQGFPLGGGNNNTVVIYDKNISFNTLVGDSAYFKMVGLEVLRNNHVTTPNSAWLNQTAIREMEIEEDATSFPMWGAQITIKGIVKDFQSEAMNSITPALIVEHSFQDGVYNFSPSGTTPWEFLVQVTGDPYSANEQVKKLFERFTEGEVYNGVFVDAQMREIYASQRKATKLIILFTIIGIVISALGLLAMSTYFIRQRTQEIAVRKVFGSSNQEVTQRLVSHFLILIGVAFVIAVPLIWFFMSKWLATYVVRIPLSPLIFMAAGFITLLVAFLTVITQSVHASHTNPVELQGH